LCGCVREGRAVQRPLSRPDSNPHRGLHERLPARSRWLLEPFDSPGRSTNLLATPAIPRAGVAAPSAQGGLESDRGRRGCMKPTISVAMTTYNGAAYIGEQLESLACQTVPPIEMQIGDDGSTDETEAIVKSFARTAPFPVTYVRNSERLFFGENSIRTALRCSGDWISFCDQDDVWDPRKFEWATDAICQGPPDLNLLVHNAFLTDEKLKPGKLLYDYPAGETVTGRLDLRPEWYSWGFTQIFRASLVRDIPSARR